MNTLNRSDLDAVQGIIREIEENSLGGAYLYRGEPKRHLEAPYCGRVSSSLYRKYAEIAQQLSLKQFQIEYIQLELLHDAKPHLGIIDKSTRQLSPLKRFEVSMTTDRDKDFSILAQLKHYGGDTNLIDFTVDYRIALFFACDGSPNEPGRVILLKRTKEVNKMVWMPEEPRHRVQAQKSVFIRPLEGFIGPENENVCIVCVPAALKGTMLAYLRNFHGIEAQTIYNDIHGFITNRRIHQDAYRAYGEGLVWESRAGEGEGELYPDEGTLLQAKREAIKCYTRAIEQKPDYPPPYNNRSRAYCKIGMYTEAIADCDVALRLPNSNEAEIYYHRGMARIHKHEWTEAIVDLIVARVKGANLVGGFTYERYGSIEAFERIIEVSLPESISNLLTKNLDEDIEVLLGGIRTLAEGRDEDIKASLPKTISNLLAIYDGDEASLPESINLNEDIKVLLRILRTLTEGRDVDIEDIEALLLQYIRLLLTSYGVDIDAPLLESIRNLLTGRDED